MSIRKRSPAAKHPSHAQGHSHNPNRIRIGDGPCMEERRRIVYFQAGLASGSTRPAGMPLRGSSSRPPGPRLMAGRARSMRGARRQSFHARRVAPSSSPADRKWFKARTKAPRTDERINGGTSCSVGTGWRNSSCKSTASSCSHAATGTPAAGRAALVGAPAPPSTLRALVSGRGNSATPSGERRRWCCLARLRPLLLLKSSVCRNLVVSVPKRPPTVHAFT